jgi:SAM-dependent methyltransferase
MEAHEYRRMFELEDHHWWFRSRLMMTEGWLQEYLLPHYPARRPKLLDLGCGTGLFLQRRGADCEAYGIDLSPEALSYCRERQLRPVALADALRLPIRDAQFDLVTAFDLIEHVDDDHDLVREIWRVLRPGGCLLATVPAHPILWTGHDVSLHHRRRYTRRAFEALFPAGQWERVRMTASFTMVFPLAALVRLTRHLLATRRPPRSDTAYMPEGMNRLLIGLHRWEAAWLRRHDLPIGISFMTLRRKRLS